MRARLRDNRRVEAVRNSEERGVSEGETLTFDLRGGKKALLRGMGWPVGVGCAAVAVALIAHPPKGPGDSAGSTLGLVALLLVMGIALVCLVERRLSVRVVAEPEALLVRNTVRRYTIPWTEIDDWRDGPPGDAGVRLKGGHRVQLQGLDPGWFGNTAPQAEKLDELRAYHRRMLGTQ